jgi:predicted phage terminase large subunit-like protein
MSLDLIHKIRETYPNYNDYQAIKMAMHLDLMTFVSICSAEAITNKTPDFHHEIARFIQNKHVTRLNILSFRGSAKSTIASYFLPLWKVCTKGEEVPYILIISESQGQAKNFLDRIKAELSGNEKIKHYFGDLGENTAQRWQADDIILANGSRIKAMGTGQKPRGVIQRHTRPNLIILDDIESESNGATPEARAINRKWMTNAIVPTLTPNGKIVMIGTVISDDCLMMVAKKSTVWKSLEYAILDEQGKPTWEDRYDLAWIEAKKKEYEEMLNPSGFYQEYMNMPQSPEDAPFREEWFKHHKYELINENNLNYLVDPSDKEKIPCYVTCGVDLASSLSIKADFTVFTTIAHTLYNKHYVIDVMSMKADPAYHPDKLIAYYLKYKHNMVCIETVAYQETMRAAVRRICEEKGLWIPGLEAGIKPRTSKSERILSLVPTIASGRFYIKSSMINLVKEFVSFPRGSHDDQIDAVWTAMSKAKKPYHKVLTEEDKKKKKKNNLDWMTL